MRTSHYRLTVWTHEYNHLSHANTHIAHNDISNSTELVGCMWMASQPRPPKEVPYSALSASIFSGCSWPSERSLSTPIYQTCAERFASIWTNPTLTAINALALRKAAEDVALQVWLYLSLHQVSYLGLVFSIGLKLCSHHLG